MGHVEGIEEVLDGVGAGDDGRHPAQLDVVDEVFEGAEGLHFGRPDGEFPDKVGPGRVVRKVVRGKAQGGRGRGRPVGDEAEVSKEGEDGKEATRPPHADGVEDPGGGEDGEGSEEKREDVGGEEAADLGLAGRELEKVPSVGEVEALRQQHLLPLAPCQALLKEGEGDLLQEGCGVVIVAGVNVVAENEAGLRQRSLVLRHKVDQAPLLDKESPLSTVPHSARPPRRAGSEGVALGRGPGA